MPVINIETRVNAPAVVVFDLARSIDLHKLSTAHTHEQAIAGVTSGLIGMGESVTWRAMHFGLWLTLSSKITAFDAPHSFTDEMVAGPFKSFRHEHYFIQHDGFTVMTDAFDYTSPFGIAGKIADKLFVEKYMRQLLITRNQYIKEVAEDADKYKKILPQVRQDQQ